VMDDHGAVNGFDRPSLTAPEPPHEYGLDVKLEPLLTATHTPPEALPHSTPPLPWSTLMLPP